MRAGVVSILGTAALIAAAPAFGTDHSDAFCDEVQKLVDAAFEDAAFGSLSPEFGAGAFRGTYQASDALGTKDGRPCRMINLRGRGKVLTCPLPIHGFADYQYDYTNALAARRHFTAKVKTCSAVEGYKVTGNSATSDSWTSPNRKVQVAVDISGTDPGQTVSLGLKVTAF